MQIRTVAFAATMAVLAAAPASAQTTAVANVTMTIPTVLYISVNTPNVNFAQPSEADFDTGYIDQAGGTVTHRGNVAHDVQVRGTLDNKPAGSSLTIADLSVDVDNTGFKPLAGVDADVVTNAAKGDHVKPLTYRFNLPYDAVPGTYDATVTYTIVQH